MISSDKPTLRAGRSGIDSW